MRERVFKTATSLVVRRNECGVFYGGIGFANWPGMWCVLVGVPN